MQGYTVKIKEVKPTPLEIESMSAFIENLKDEDDLDFYKLVYRMTLNIGYEISKQAFVLDSLGIVYSYSDLHTYALACLSNYHNRRREKLLSFTYFKKAV